MMYVLILTLFGPSSQSGQSIAVQEFNTQGRCEAAKAAWLASVPRREDDGKIYYDISASPRAMCVPK